MQTTLSTKLTLPQMQQQWAAQINPVLQNPLSGSSILTGVKLTPGLNVINHLLGRKLQGWVIVGDTSGSTIYDGQSVNSMTDLTLWLISGLTCTVNILVF